MGELGMGVSGASSVTVMLIGDERGRSRNGEEGSRDGDIAHPEMELFRRTMPPIDARVFAGRISPVAGLCLPLSSVSGPSSADLGR